MVVRRSPAPRRRGVRVGPTKLEGLPAAWSAPAVAAVKVKWPGAGGALSQMLTGRRGGRGVTAVEPVGGDGAVRWDAAADANRFRVDVEPSASPRGGGAGKPDRGVFFSILYGFQEQGRGKDPVRLEEIGTAMISLEECCWEMQLQQQQHQKGGAPLQQLVVVPIRVRKDGWASDALLYNTHTYFTRLMAAMRKNVKFSIDEICQGVEPTVAVMWHLEWNGKIIPFTKGCSFYMCSANGEALLIRKVHIFNEPPLKPGKPALEILLFVAKLFDTLPKEAEAFLQNPEALVRPIVKLYKFCVEPFVVYLLAYYINFWSFVAQGLTMVLGILYNIFKRFV